MLNFLKISHKRINICINIDAFCDCRYIVCTLVNNDNNNIIII